jgi:hypothetical protein
MISHLPLGERLAAMETKMEHLETHLSARMDKMESKVDEMHSVLTMGKGAKWIAFAAVTGLLALLGAAYHLASIIRPA